MTIPKAISYYISSLAISLALALPAGAQSMDDIIDPPDTTVNNRWFDGFALSVDLAGVIQRAVSDYGQYEAALRINIDDTWFPILEVGLGSASHDDVVTLISYKSSAPYFRFGADHNFLKDKHDIYRVYGGARYAFSYFNYDVSHPGVKDTNWGGVAQYGEKGVKCNAHWLEFAAGVDAKIWGPIHLGWSVRYRRRLFADNGSMGNVWYIPGFGKAGRTCIGGTFNVGIDL